HIHDLIVLGRKVGIPVEREKEYLTRFITGIHDLGKELGKSLVDIQNLHAHLHSIFEAVQEPIFAVDDQGKVTFINRLAAELFE
ncbi:PAS domain-containing protein, partial [Pantoea sp. SIMBA_079]